VKKKSPPYAIIGAAVLGIIAVFIYLQHEKSVQADAQAAMDKAKRDAQAAIDAANARQPVPTVVDATPTNMRKVYYATQPIDPGVHISPSFYELKMTPVDILPDAYSEGPGVDLDGMFATRNIEKGDAFTPRNVGKELPFMSGRISPGMRLLALPIFNADSNSTGGFVVDGDKVDLLYTTGASTQLVMQNLNVLYVPGPPIRTKETEGVNPAPAPGDPISVAFEVTPEQAQALVYMTQNPGGHFSMILRSRRDTANLEHLKPFNGGDYADNLKKLQRTTDTSILRVQELQKQIEAEEEKNKAQGNTNAPPTPPSP
jgi:Flp pilus assembly protein CpaB